MTEPVDKNVDPGPHFLLLGMIFEGATAVVAVAVGALDGSPPLRFVSWNASGLGWGLLASLPLFLVMLAILYVPLGPLARLAQVVDRMLVPLFRNASWWDLLAISSLAGLGEELLFRGVIQHQLASAVEGPVGIGFALVLTSIVFGMAHWITPGYAVLTTLIGLYLGGLWLWTDNLLAPIVTHAAYDFLALAYLVRMRRPREEEGGGGEG